MNDKFSIEFIVFTLICHFGSHSALNVFLSKLDPPPGKEIDLQSRKCKEKSRRRFYEIGFNLANFFRTNPIAEWISSMPKK